MPEPLLEHPDQLLLFSCRIGIDPLLSAYLKQQLFSAVIKN